MTERKRLLLKNSLTRAYQPHECFKFGGIAEIIRVGNKRPSQNSEIVMISQKIREPIRRVYVRFHHVRPDLPQQSCMIPVILHTLTPFVEFFGRGLFTCCAHGLSRTLIGLAQTASDGVITAIVQHPFCDTFSRST